MEKTTKKIFVVGLIGIGIAIAILAMNANAIVTPSEVWVDDDFDSSTPGWGYDHFDTIQKGVDNVSAGGIVHVWNGTYNENVDVGKTVTIIGNGSASCIVTAADSDDSVFYVNADHVNIFGLNITGGSRGVLLKDNTDYCNISDNILYNNGWGIGIYGKSGGTSLSYMSDNNVVMNNTILNNVNGIWMCIRHSITR